LIDNQIDPATGTMRLKGEFANSDERLWPGEFVNVRLVLATRAACITVPRAAVMQGASGYYLYVIKPDNTVSRRNVQVSDLQENTAIVDKGLAVGEKIVVDGQYRLIDGSHIRVDAPKPQAETPAGGSGKSG